MIFVKKNGQLIRADGKGKKDIFVIVSENGVEDIIPEKEVPELTEEQLQEAYNQVVNGAVVIIASELGEYFAVKQACEESDNPVIYFDYANSHILRYELGEEVEITAKAIGEGGSSAVESVNGKTGVVVLNASDILAQNAQTIQQNLARIDEEINRVESELTESIGDVASDLETEVSARESLDDRVEVVEASVSDIEALIPDEASSSNKLADKQFVNSSIATNTAIFRGTYDVVEDLGLTQEATHEQVATALASEITTKTNNDYAFVFFKDSEGLITRYDRYKYNGSAFAYEYTLNNSSFTAQQWAAINSGITASLVAKISEIDDKADVDDVYDKDTIDDLLENVAKTDEANTFSQKQTFSNGVKTSSIEGATQSANTDDIINGTFNVINASDIVNNTLTQAQYDLITNRKPALIKGTILSLSNIFIECFAETSSAILLQYESGLEKGCLEINKTTKVISKTAQTIGRIQLRSISQLNAKTIPSYPENNVDGQLVYRNNALAWLDDTPVIDTTSTSYSGGISSNKEYSFTQPLTALNITTLNTTTGDNSPIWSVSFVAGSNFALTLPTGATIKWQGGIEPTFTQGNSYTIMLKQVGTYYLAICGEFINE